jgi:hypothetical protein
MLEASNFKRGEAPMTLQRLVMSAAAIAILGCSDGGAEGGLPVPPFSGPLVGSGSAESVGPAGPQGASPDSSSNGAGGGASTELNPDNLGIDNVEPPGAGTSDMGAGAPDNAGAEQPSTEEPEPVPEEPPPIVRPPLDCGAPPQALQGNGAQGCQANAEGRVNGQDWFLWYTGGSGCMTAYDNLSGAFTAQWNNPGDFLARIGHWFDETQTFEELGELGADLAFTRQGNAGGFSFIGIYGWSTSPIVEYYIVEDSFGNGPAQPFATQLRGNFTVDGAQYNVYTGNRVNQPSIVGTSDFVQVLSVRQNPRQCGHVSISEHFRQWRGMGINLGQAKEAKILVEAGGGNGSITFHHANVTVTPPDAD